jgi:DNA-binding transcriptional regulator YdaS (Cro superfamily)
MNAITQLTPRQLRQAADIQEKIVSLQKKLADLLGAPVAPLAQQKKKRTISAAGIARIRAAQKARWAKVKGANK